MLFEKASRCPPFTRPVAIFLYKGRTVNTTPAAPTACKLQTGLPVQGECLEIFCELFSCQIELLCQRYTLQHQFPCVELVPGPLEPSDQLIIHRNI